RMRFSRVTTLTLLLLTFTTFPVVQGIKLQQLSLVVAALISACAFCLIRGWQAPAGVLLAIASIKPHLIAPLELWLLLWAAFDFALRWKFAASLLLTMAALITAGKLLLAGWPYEFVAAVRAYVGYNGTHSLLDDLVTRTLAWPIEIFLII